MDEAAGDHQNSKRCRKSTDDSDDEELSLKLSDKSVLECPICFHPLTVPVFQCTNGHLTCSSCHSALKPKCPTCSSILGDSRNRAVEKILESLKASCSYKATGCTVELTYSSKSSHEQNCAYAPYNCPFLKDCNFLGSPTELHVHLKQNHESSVINLKSIRTYSKGFSKKKDDEFVVFLLPQGHDNAGGSGAIFILNYRTMRVICIQDPELLNSMDLRLMMVATHKFGRFVFPPIVINLCRNANAANTEVLAEATDSAAKELLKFLDGLIKMVVFVSS